ncbi:MAG TPA: N-acetylmuramoyl-L-alanine amidase [Limnochordia bacterium]|nr:N-acetylmuramoyl-L-alanine amidase [Limnochordia bacterium]
MFKRPLILVVHRASLVIAAAALIVLWAGAWIAAETDRGPLHGVTLVVDAGHGGTERGVCYTSQGLIEKEINLDVAKRLKTALERAGAKVLLTRADDAELSLDARPEVANTAPADLFLSIHTNRIPGHPECFGAQTFYYPDSVAGKRLAEMLQAELLKVDPANTRAALAGRYKVLRLAEMPSALVEIGFLTNARDRGLIATDAYRDKITAAIVAGVIRYLREAPAVEPQKT